MIASNQITEYEGVKLNLIDTQGLSDGAGYSQGMNHIKNMVEKIKEFESIDLFLLCLDGFNPRMVDYTKATINLFTQIFLGFLTHLVNVFNKWIWADEKKKESMDENVSRKIRN